MDLKFDQTVQDLVLSVDGSGAFDIALTRDTEDDLSQRLFVRFKTYKKDLFWNLGYGIDYLNKVFGVNRPKSSVDAILISEIKKEPLVEELVSFESTNKNYTYSCKFTVKSKIEGKVSTFHILTDENGFTLSNEEGLALTSRI